MTIEFDGQNNKITRDTAGSIKVDRKTSDGNIIEFQKDGTTVGNIGVASSDLNIYGDVGIKFSGDDVRPTDSSGNNSDNAVDLGHFDVRWQDLYLGGNIYLGGTGSANALDDYEEGEWTPIYEPQTGSFTSLTLNTNKGTYIKIGKKVFIEGRISVDGDAGTDLTGASGRLLITGLPFTAKSHSSSTGFVGGGQQVSTQSNWAGTTGPQLCAVNGSEIRLLFIDGTSSNITRHTEITDMSTATSVRNGFIFNANYVIA